LKGLAYKTYLLICE